MREPRRLPRAIEPHVAADLIAAARSWRDKALLTLLWRTGQRIGDWGEGDADGHGVLGMRLTDFHRAEEMVVVRLKGARDEHGVPVTPDFWPLFERYLLIERSDWPGCEAAWMGSRRRRRPPVALRRVRVGAARAGQEHRRHRARAHVPACGRPGGR